MFKNLKKSEKIMIGVFFLIVTLFAYYMFIISPYLDKRADLVAQIDELESGITSPEKLKRELSNLDMEATGIKNEIDKFKKNNMLKIIDNKEFVEFIGLNSKVYDITIKDFKEDTDNSDSSSYKKKTYKLAIQGEYNDIVKFSNSLYQLRNHFYVKDVKLEKVELIPMTSKVTNGSDEKFKEITFNWFSKYNGKVDRLIPSDIVKDSIPDNLKQYDKKKSKLDQVYKKQEYNKEVVQLAFKLHFIDYDNE